MLAYWILPATVGFQFGGGRTEGGFYYGRWEVLIIMCCEITIYCDEQDGQITKSSVKQRAIHVPIAVYLMVVGRVGRSEKGCRIPTFTYGRDQIVCLSNRRDQVHYFELTLMNLQVSMSLAPVISTLPALLSIHPYTTILSPALAELQFTAILAVIIPPEQQQPQQLNSGLTDISPWPSAGGILGGSLTPKQSLDFCGCTSALTDDRQVDSLQRIWFLLFSIQLAGSPPGSSRLKGKEQCPFLMKPLNLVNMNSAQQIFFSIDSPLHQQNSFPSSLMYNVSYGLSSLALMCTYPSTALPAQYTGSQVCSTI